MWNANQDDDELDLRFQNEVRRLGHLNGAVLRWNVKCVLCWFSVVSIFSLWATALLNTYCFSCCAHFTNWYIYLLDNEISTFYTVRHPYHPDAPNIYTQPVSLSEAPLTLGIADDLCFQAEAFFFKCPLSRSSVKQLLGSHVPLLLDMSMIAMVFIICNRPAAILLWHRKVVAGCRYLHCTVTNSGWCFGIKSVPYLEGV